MVLCTKVPRQGDVKVTSRCGARKEIVLPKNEHDRVNLTCVHYNRFKIAVSRLWRSRRNKASCTWLSCCNPRGPYISYTMFRTLQLHSEVAHSVTLDQWRGTVYRPTWSTPADRNTRILRCQSQHVRVYQHLHCSYTLNLSVPNRFLTSL